MQKKVFKLAHGLAVYVPASWKLNVGDLVELNPVGVLTNNEVDEAVKALEKNSIEDKKSIPDIRKQIASITSGNSRKPKMQVDNDYSLVSEDSI